MKHNDRISTIAIILTIIIMLPAVIAEDEIDYTNPETITADNWDRVETSMLDSNSLERSGMSVDDIREQATSDQALAYRNSNQPIVNPTAKELALLSKISEYSNIDTHSFEGTDLSINGNLLMSGSVSINIPQGSSPTLNRNSDGSISLGDDITVRSGLLTDHGNGHITFGPDSDFSIMNTDLTATKPITLFDIRYGSPIDDIVPLPNSISFSDSSLYINAQDSNTITINDRGEPADFNNLFVTSIDETSVISYSIDGSAATIRGQDISYQARHNMPTDIIVGEHDSSRLTIISSEGMAMMCRSPCTALGSADLPKNFEKDGKVFIAEQRSIDIYPYRDDAQLVTAKYNADDGTSIYQIQFAGMESPLYLNQRDYDFLMNGGTATINGEFTTVRPVLKDLQLSYTYNPDGESARQIPGTTSVAHPVARSTQNLIEALQTVENQAGSISGFNSKIETAGTQTAEEDEKRRNPPTARPQTPPRSAPEAIIIQPPASSPRYDPNWVDPSKVSPMPGNPNTGRYYNDPDRPNRYIYVQRDSPDSDEWYDPGMI